jgi:hypothetical protein
VRHAAHKATTQRDRQRNCVAPVGGGHLPVSCAAVGGSDLPSGYACQEAPTPEDAGTARRILLDGLARDADVLELVSELALLHPPDNTFPCEVFLRLAADALDC